VFQSQGDGDKAAACSDMVVKIWTAVLCRVVLGMVQVRVRHTRVLLARCSQPPAQVP
jgi:hypothetical protein